MTCSWPGAITRDFDTVSVSWLEERCWSLSISQSGTGCWGLTSLNHLYLAGLKESLLDDFQFRRPGLAGASKRVKRWGMEGGSEFGGHLEQKANWCLPSTPSSGILRPKYSLKTLAFLQILSSSSQSYSKWGEAVLYHGLFLQFNSGFVSQSFICHLPKYKGIGMPLFA